MRRRRAHSSGRRPLGARVLRGTLSRHRGCLAALLAAGLVGCSASGERDGPPAATPDLEHVADAVPRPEPRSAYGNPVSYVVHGRRYRTLESARGYVERGIASWYGRKFHGRRTSSGEPYDMFAMTAAHRTLPLPTYVRVTHLQNGREVVVRVNDRGPFKNGRLIDLSYAAAYKLGIVGRGTGPVEVRAIDPTKRTQPAGAGALAPGLYVQVGAFVHRANAERLRGRLHSLVEGPPVHIEEAAGAGSRPLYRVRIGPLADTAVAERMASRLRTHGLAGAHRVVAGVEAPDAAPVRPVVE